MRPRISKFGTITRNVLFEHFNKNYIWMLTATIKDNVIIYHGEMMFRENKRPPEKIHITVSRASKNVISAESERHGKFLNVDELLKYTKRSS